MVFLGAAIAIIAIMIGAPDVRENIMVYLQPASFIMVIGGTIGSTMISSSKEQFKNNLIIIRQVLFRPKKLQPKEAVEILVHVSKVAQTASKQALAKEGVGKGDGFLERALGLVADGLDKDFINRTLETDIMEIRRRHTTMNTNVKTMGSYAPMFGMAGTVIGVIQVLKNVTDIDNIVSGMALALLPTLYGLVLSMIIFIPFSNKLKGMSDSEIMVKEIIREGIMMILDREIPLKVERYLTAYIAKNEMKNDKKKKSWTWSCWW